MVKFMAVDSPVPAALVADIVISRVDSHSLCLIGRLYRLSFPANVTMLPLMVTVYSMMGQGSSGNLVHNITISLKYWLAVKLTAGGGSKNRLSKW